MTCSISMVLSMVLLTALVQLFSVFLWPCTALLGAGLGTITITSQPDGVTLSSFTNLSDRFWTFDDRTYSLCISTKWIYTNLWMCNTCLSHTSIWDNDEGKRNCVIDRYRLRICFSRLYKVILCLYFYPMTSKSPVSWILLTCELYFYNVVSCQTFKEVYYFL